MFQSKGAGNIPSQTILYVFIQIVKSRNNLTQSILYFIIDFRFFGTGEIFFSEIIKRVHYFLSTCRYAFIEVKTRPVAECSQVRRKLCPASGQLILRIYNNPFPGVSESNPRTAVQILKICKHKRHILVKDILCSSHICFKSVFQSIFIYKFLFFSFLYPHHTLPISRPSGVNTRPMM